MKRLITIIIPLITITACNTKKEVDLIIHTNTVYTCNNTFNETVSLAIKDGIIVDEGERGNQ